MTFQSNEELLDSLKENVIQGRRNQDDEGIEEGMVGSPGVKELTQEAIELGINPALIIKKGVGEGMIVVGEKFAAQEYFIPDMLASAEAVGEVMDLLRPHMEKADIQVRGKVMVGTVKGDLHDIGKNIVATLLKGAGYEVIDLGIDVSPEKIVEAVKEYHPNILGLSALLTSTMQMMRETIGKLEDGGVRDQIKVVVGGAPVSGEFAQEIGADGYGRDGFEAIKLVEELTRQREN